MQIVAGTFSSRAEAESIFPDLGRLGIVRSEIVIIEGGDREGFDREHLPMRRAIVRGGLAGGGLALAIGALMLLFSRVHPLFALPPMILYLIAIAIGTAGGAAISGFWNIGHSHDEALLFEEAERTGAVIAAVEVANPIEDEVTSTLGNHGASDVRRGDWRPQWWKYPWPTDTNPTEDYR